MENSQEYITKQCIIEEYLNNWFTYEELASYLCIDISEVKMTLETGMDMDDKLAKKVRTHHEHIDKYYQELDNPSPIFYSQDNCRILEIAKYMLDNASSVRETAKYFGIGKTTVHETIHEKLPKISILIYKDVFDTLMSNKSFSTNNKKVIEQVLKSYDLLVMGLSSKEIQEKLGIGRNVLQRNLTTRLKNIDKEKFEIAKQILQENQTIPLKENGFKKNAK